MKYVKCIYTGSNQQRLTKDKIYDVIVFTKEWVRIINDEGDEEFYYMEDTDGIWFVDATADIREEKLNNLGIL